LLGQDFYRIRAELRRNCQNGQVNLGQIFNIFMAGQTLNLYASGVYYKNISCKFAIQYIFEYLAPGFFHIVRGANNYNATWIY